MRKDGSSVVRHRLLYKDFYLISMLSQEANNEKFLLSQFLEQSSTQRFLRNDEQSSAARSLTDEHDDDDDPPSPFVDLNLQVCSPRLPFPYSPAESVHSTGALEEGELPPSPLLLHEEEEEGLNHQFVETQTTLCDSENSAEEAKLLGMCTASQEETTSSPNQNQEENESISGTDTSGTSFTGSPSVGEPIQRNFSPKHHEPEEEENTSSARKRRLFPTYTMTKDEIILNLTVVVKPKDMPLPLEYKNATNLEIPPCSSSAAAAEEPTVNPESKVTANEQEPDLHADLPDHVSASYFLEMLNDQECQEMLDKRKRRRRQVCGRSGGSSRCKRPYRRRSLRGRSRSRRRFKSAEKDSEEGEGGSVHVLSQSFRNPNLTDLRHAAPNFCSTLAEVRSRYGAMGVDDRVSCQMPGCYAQLLFRGSSMLQHVYKHAPGRIFRCPRGERGDCSFKGAAFSFMVIDHIRKKHPEDDPYNFVDLRAVFDEQLADATLLCYSGRNR